MAPTTPLISLCAVILLGCASAPLAATDAPAPAPEPIAAPVPSATTAAPVAAPCPYRCPRAGETDVVICEDGAIFVAAEHVDAASLEAKVRALGTRRIRAKASLEAQLRFPDVCAEVPGMLERAGQPDAVLLTSAGVTCLCSAEPCAASALVTLEATVVKFSHGAMIDHYEDGSFANFDGTTLQIVAPPEHAGRTLSFFHGEALPESSAWRKVGQRVRFSIPLDSLTDGRQLFTAAARGFQPL